MPEDFIKPSHKAIKDYYAALTALRGQGGKRETELRAAFQELLGKLARQRGWTFMPERPINRDGKRVVPDGTLLDEGVPLGHWEAKDGDDNLAVEVKKKIEKGYPTDNIIFEDTHQAIHYQNGIELKTKNLYDPAELCLLLNQFFAYEKPVQQSFKQALAKFREDVPELARHLQDTLKKAHSDNAGFKKAFGDFFELCKSSLNPSITQSTVDEMLVQHLLTERIFRKVFKQEDFTRRNVIANEVEKVIDALKAQEFDRSKFLKGLDYFYKAIEAQAEDLGDYSEKQELLNTVYERFFQGYSVKVADTHGIVYTPQAIVDFMCASVDEVLQKEFGTTLGGKEVNILDPCTGTGNFIVNLIRRIPRSDLERVYKQQLFANEIMLLPYYIAALNIEHAYWERTGEYESFEGLCFVDTLELAESKQKGLSFMTKANAVRVERQRKAPITVIIGNPPYNAHQESENDANKNRKYEVIDKRIKETYSADSKATNKNALSDAYVKFFRWAVDRLGERDGVVCYVSNNSFVDQVAFDGMRKHLLRDFTHIYHVDLHGNVRQNPKLSGTTHNVFGIQVGVGITVAVRSKKHKGGAIDYVRVVEDWRREQKYAWLDEQKSVGNVDWQRLKPDSKESWLVPDGADEFARLLPVGDKESKAAHGLQDGLVFATFSGGVKTNRDEVVYDFQRDQLIARVKAFINEYNAEVDRYKRITDKIKTTADDFVNYENLKWSRDLKQDMTRGNSAKFADSKIRTALYRPFCQRSLFFDRILNEEVYVFPHIFPTLASENHVIGATDLGSEKPFMALAARSIADLHLVGAGAQTQCFPFYVYDEDGKNRRENITDWALKTFREAYGDKSISKWDIFHYVYAMLHHRGYREKFKDCLKRELPRIPFAGFGGAGFQPAAVPEGKDRQAGSLPHTKEEGKGQDRQAGSLPHIYKHSRGKLPHWERDGAHYFVTFRLADSLPESARAAIEFERADIVKTAEHLGRELSENERQRLERLHTVKIEELLHAGHGACHLKDDRCAQVVADALKHFDGRRYTLNAWCVMPNHVHVVFRAHEGHSLSDIMHSWKSFTANQCNKLLGRKGAFWMDESFDRLIRDEAEFDKRVAYTLDNPKAAGLKNWKWLGRGAGFKPAAVPEGNGQDRQAGSLPHEEAASKNRQAGSLPHKDFRAFVTAGEKLAKLHLDYEKLEPWPLKEVIKEGAKNRDLWRVEKMRLSKDKKSLTVNEWVTLEGIPERCFEYRLGNRSALEWVIDQYQVSEDKKSGIRSDPNREDDPQYIVRLVKQVVRVSMETLDIIDSLPESYGGPLPQ